MVLLRGYKNRNKYVGFSVLLCRSTIQAQLQDLTIHSRGQNRIFFPIGLTGPFAAAKAKAGIRWTVLWQKSIRCQICRLPVPRLNSSRDLLNPEILSFSPLGLWSRICHSGVRVHFLTCIQMSPSDFPTIRLLLSICLRLDFSTVIRWCMFSD